MADILTYIAKAVIVLAPAWAANGAPPLGRFIPGLKRLYIPVYPRLLGDHKTWGGYTIGIIIGFLVGVISYFTFDPYSICSLAAGPLLGLGALFGDSVGSFVKRRIGYKPGETCWYLDFTDWLLGAWLVAYFIWPNFNWRLVVASSILPIPTFLISYISSRTKIKESL